MIVSFQHLARAVPDTYHFVRAPTTSLKTSEQRCSLLLFTFEPAADCARPELASPASKRYRRLLQCSRIPRQIQVYRYPLLA